MRISVFGSTGFIGQKFTALYNDEVLPIEREARAPHGSWPALYLISTTDNYHVFEDPTLDVRTNLVVLTEVLDM